jgi:hypothetical protein
MSIHGEIDRALRELDDCERAIKASDSDRALRELRSAVSKIKAVESKVKRLERESKA